MYPDLLDFMLAVQVERKPHWRTHTGEVKPVDELESSHLFNIVKYFMTDNRVPPKAILDELQNRNLLPHLAAEIGPRENYKSPEEVYDAIKSTAYSTVS